MLAHLSLLVKKSVHINYVGANRFGAFYAFEPLTDQPKTRILGRLILIGSFENETHFPT